MDKTTQQTGSMASLSTWKCGSVLLKVNQGDFKVNIFLIQLQLQELKYITDEKEDKKKRMIGKKKLP